MHADGVYICVFFCYTINMKFKLKSTPAIQILLWIIAAISLVGLVVGILSMVGVPIEVTHIQGILLISVCSFTLLISLLFATIHYKVDANYIHLNIAFIDMLSNRIQIDKILNIVIDNDRFYISYLWKGLDPVIAAIMIQPKRFEDMKSLLMSRNANIVFYETKKDETTDSEQQ